jgi:MAE_28990/MAE_18760-like HEPN
MPQVRTTAEFSSTITADLTWRFREISDLRAAVRRIDEEFRRSLLRASVPLVYAHWEGHVSVVAKSYLEFLALRRPRYSTLKPSFRLNEFFATFRRMRGFQLKHQQIIEFLERVLRCDDLQFRRIDEDLISTKSNLSSHVLKELCLYLSIDCAPFEDDYDFIDKILLYRRNNIAHGEYMQVDAQMLEEMSNRVIKMMRTFNNLVENDVVLGRYNVAG